MLSINHKLDYILIAAEFNQWIIFYGHQTEEKVRKAILEGWTVLQSFNNLSIIQREIVSKYIFDLTYFGVLIIGREGYSVTVTRALIRLFNNVFCYRLIPF